MIIKQFGAPRSATNYTKFLLESNYDVQVLVNSFGWKHGCVKPRLPKGIPCVISVKNIFAWLDSMERYHRVPNKWLAWPRQWSSLSDFITSKFVYGVDHRRAITYKSIIDYWNTVYANWLDLPLTGRPIFVVRHEDLLKDPQPITKELALQFGLTRTTSTFADSVFALNTMSKLTTRLFNENYYLYARYMQKFNQTLVQFVLENIDHDVYRRLGYGEICIA